VGAPFGAEVIGGALLTGKLTVQILLSGATLSLPTRVESVDYAFRPLRQPPV
jgi:hypothetical protein